MTKTIFGVYGPFVVPCHKGDAGRTITKNEVIEFWDFIANEFTGDLANDRGCYVFGIRAGRGYTPTYVGKAAHSFKQEVFSPHKLAKYHQCLTDYKKGTPIVFLVAAPFRPGVTNRTHIHELEAFLIQNALSANSSLLNIRGTQKEKWGIAGVLRSGKGNRTQYAHELKKMLKI